MVEAETDTCASPITQASILTDEWFSYDKDGRLTDVWELTPHSGGYYHTAVTYYSNGAVNSLTGIPGYAAINYGVDGEGRTSGASQDTTTIINNVTFNAASQPLTVSISTLGDNDTYTYDPATGRMNMYKFTVNGVSDTGTLTWNTNGTLRQLAIVDGFNSGGTQTCTFSYDDLARLTSDNCGAIWSQTFSYDQYGNLTKSGSITWAPGYNAVNNQYSSIGATYDLAGDVTYDSFNSYTWNASGKMSSVRAATSPAVCGTSGTCVTYDANGRPVEKNVAGVYSEILYSPMGETAIMSGASTVTQSYIPLPGGLTMIATGAGGTGTRRIEHRDWLGTGRLATTLTNRTVVYDRAFAPYGEVYANFGTTSYSDFTGDKQDLFVGLFDTPNRELAPTQGRWISPDPARSGWNQYAYVSNAPLNLIDPTGLWQRRRVHGSRGKGASGGCSGEGWSGCPAYTVNGADVPSWVGQGLLLSGVGEQCPNNQCQPWSPPPPSSQSPSSSSPVDYGDGTGQNGIYYGPQGYAALEANGLGAGIPYSMSLQPDAFQGDFLGTDPLTGNLISVANWGYEITDINGDRVQGEFQVTEHLTQLQPSIEILADGSIVPTPPASPSMWTTGPDGTWTDQIGFALPSRPTIFMSNTEMQTFSVNYYGTEIPMSTVVQQVAIQQGGSLVANPIIVKP